MKKGYEDSISMLITYFLTVIKTGSNQNSLYIWPLPPLVPYQHRHLCNPYWCNQISSACADLINKVDREKSLIRESEKYGLNFLQGEKNTRSRKKMLLPENCFSFLFRSRSERERTWRIAKGLCHYCASFAIDQSSLSRFDSLIAVDNPIYYLAIK